MMHGSVLLTLQQMPTSPKEVHGRGCTEKSISFIPAEQYQRIDAIPLGILPLPSIAALAYCNRVWSRSCDDINLGLCRLPCRKYSKCLLPQRPCLHSRTLIGKSIMKSVACTGYDTPLLAALPAQDVRASHVSARLHHSRNVSSLSGTSCAEFPCCFEQFCKGCHALEGLQHGFGSALSGPR